MTIFMILDVNHIFAFPQCNVVGNNFTIGFLCPIVQFLINRRQWFKTIYMSFWKEFCYFFGKPSFVSTYINNSPDGIFS